MNDLISRLRDYYVLCDNGMEHPDICDEAILEIERLNSYIEVIDVEIATSADRLGHPLSKSTYDELRGCVSLDGLLAEMTEKVRQDRVKDATEIERLDSELEKTADKLSDVWIHLDAYARGEPFTSEMAASILRYQQTPGWKS